MSKLEVLALIPARAGSQRIPGKNSRRLGDKPLLAHTIECARRAKLVTRVIVTTDSEKLARIARRYGAEAPFLRPKSISGPLSTEYEFHAHAIGWLREHEDYRPDLIVNLYPTAPFRKPTSVDLAIRQIAAKPRATSLRSVRRVSEHPRKMWVRPGKGDYLKPLLGKPGAAQTLSYQALPEVWIQNANIYITKPETLRRHENTVGDRVLFFEMSEEESLDLNTELDFRFAEWMLR